MGGRHETGWQPGRCCRLSSPAAAVANSARPDLGVPGAGSRPPIRSRGCVEPRGGLQRPGRALPRHWVCSLWPCHPAGAVPSMDLFTTGLNPGLNSSENGLSCSDTVPVSVVNLFCSTWSLPGSALYLTGRLFLEVNVPIFGTLSLFGSEPSTTWKKHHQTRV
jgi:hypothetical protein